MRRHRRGLPLQPTGSRGRSKGNSCRAVSLPHAPGTQLYGGRCSPACQGTAGGRWWSRQRLLMPRITRPAAETRGMTGHTHRARETRWTQSPTTRSR